MSSTSYANAIAAGETAMPFDLKDLMMLFTTSEPEERSIFINMLSGKKRRYVNEHHDRKIFQIHSENKYKNGKWRTYVYINGKRKTIEKSTENELYEWLFDFYKNEEDAPPTFSDVFEKYVDKKEHEDGRSFRTISENRRYFNKLSEDLRNTPITDITTSALKRWLLNEYLPTKPIQSALVKMLQTINQIFKYAISEKICVENPAIVINPKDYISRCNLNRKTDEERAFSVDELKQIKEEAMKDLKNPRNIMILVAIETGMRLGELPAIHKSDIKDGFIHVHRQQLKNTKTKPESYYEVNYTKDEKRHPHNGRKVPITPECEKALRYAEDLPGNSDYVFHNKDGSWVFHNGYMEHLKDICEKLGIKTDNNHAFRFAFNSRLIELGYSPADRASILGHKVETNERNYSVTDTRRLNDLKDRLRANPLSP